jgi:hypothetical protein
MAGNPGKNALFVVWRRTGNVRFEGLGGGGRSRMRTGLCIENPCFATRTAKSRRRLADPTDEKRRWQSGFEQPPALRSGANNREFARRYQGIERRRTGGRFKKGG